MRVSVVGGREGERFVSPGEQRERIVAACEREGFELIAVHEELDVSGGRPLGERPGLSAAVAAIEAGEAEVVIASYFDRLTRSLATQAELLQRVEAAGGSVLAVDVGAVSASTAAQWLSGTMLGAVSEYFRRSAKERSAEGQAAAVARGASMKRRPPLGYRLRANATLEPDPASVPLVRSAFEMRRDGRSTTEIRRMLTAGGVTRTAGGVRAMLANRAYLGEIRFGAMVNATAHEPIIDIDLFESVQAAVIPRGPGITRDHLLTRLRVLRCGSCGGLLTPATDMRDGSKLYRCPPANVCSGRVTISARIAEEVVVTATRAALLELHGRASVADEARRLDEEAERAQGALDVAVRTFAAAGIADEATAVEQLAELRQARDGAAQRRARLGAQPQATIDALRDWDELSRDAQRALIRSAVESAVVARGVKGAGRVSVSLR